MTDVSHADLGGDLGHGCVVPEPEDHIFDADWEARVLAMTLAMGAAGRWNIDRSRSARETLPHYAELSYYQIWYEALIRLLVTSELIGADELAAGRALHPPQPVTHVLMAAEVPAVLAAGSPTNRPVATVPAFELGQPVRIRAKPVGHHTRLPAYVAGRTGTVERNHGAHIFADTNAQLLGQHPQWLYTVVFDASDLWADARRGDTVSVDAWESYMEAA